MATIRTSTIDNIAEFDGEFTDNQKVLIQDSNDETVTKTATVSQLKSLFGSSGTEAENPGINTGNNTDYVVNSFNTKEYAWNISGDSGIGLGIYGNNTVESDPYAVKSAREELYVHFDVVLSTSNGSMMGYPDSYMAIRIEMNNEKTSSGYEKKWYDICRKPLCGLGKEGVASIDFHMVAQAQMKIKAYVYLGSGFSGGKDTIKNYINDTGTKLHIVATSLEPSPEYDYSTYLYLDSSDPVTELSIANDTIGEFAVDTYAYGTSTATGNTQLVLQVGHEIDQLEFMGKKAWYSKGSYKDGEFLGRFYCKAGGSEKLRIRIKSNTESSKPIYVLLKFHAIKKDDIEKGTVTCISSIAANTRDNSNSLMIDANGDYRLCAVQNVTSIEDNDVMIEFQGREDRMSAYCEYGADVIENAGVNGNKEKRIYYYGDQYTTFKGSATSTQKNTTINKIRFNSQYKNLPANAFQYFSVLTDIDLSNSQTTTIGDSAFLGCTALSNVALSKKTKTIGKSAFYNCTSLKSIILPEGVRDIGQYAFRNCDALESLQIPVELSGTIGGNICYEIPQNRVKLKISVPDTCTTRSGVETLVSANSAKLASLYTALATLKSDTSTNGQIVAKIVKRDGADFTYQDGGEYTLTMTITSAQASAANPVVKPVSVG